MFKIPSFSDINKYSQLYLLMKDYFIPSSKMKASAWQLNSNFDKTARKSWLENKQTLY